MSNDRIVNPAMASTAGRGLLLVMMEPQPNFVDQLNRWYTEEHLAERLRVPGFLSGRRFEAVVGSPRYLALYDLENVSVLDSPEYRAASEPPSEWTSEVRANVKITRNVYVDVSPEVDLSVAPRRRSRSELWTPATDDI